MPYTIRKQKCKQSDGDSGSYVLKYTDKSGKKHSACHTSHEKAKGQIAAIEMRRESDKNSEDSVLESLIKKFISESDEDVVDNQANTSSDRCDIVSWISNRNAADSFLSNLEIVDAELQQAPSKKGNDLVFRIRFLGDQKIKDSELERQIEAAIKKSTLCDSLSVGKLQNNPAISGRYKSLRIDFPSPEGSEKHPRVLYIVVIAALKGKNLEDTGNSGPGENDFIDIVNASGASPESPVTFIIGSKRFENVTGVLKPKRIPKVGEPKIDVLLLGPGGKAHPHGAFSFKLAASLGGAPTYGGWSTIEEHLPSSFPELEKFLDLYVAKKNPPKNPDGTYEFNGGFAMKTSDEIAEFSIYGNSSTSGGKNYGKDKVDYVVEVFDRPESSLGANGEIIIKNLVLHDAHEGAEDSKKKDALLFRDTEWEPYWLIRGAKERESGIKGKIVIKNSRIAIAPAKRAASYVDDGISESFSPMKNLLSEELTSSDKREIEKISRRQARIELERAVGSDFGKAIREEVTKVLGSKATRDEISDMIEAVLKRLRVEIGM